MYELSVNVELLFNEHGEGDDRVADRIQAVADSGMRAVEIWTWRGKDITRLRNALHSADIELQTMCVEPMGHLPDPATHDVFLAALVESAAVAQTLGCPFLVVTAGDTRPGVTHDEQHDAIVQVLRSAARILESFDATLLLENLNSRVDHVGTFLDSTAECLDILDEVDSPQVRLLYDHYHSLMMNERPEHVLNRRHELVAHVQLADVPGRHEPGVGTLDWRHELAVLHDLGYQGRFGLEYVPSTESVASLSTIRQVVKSLNSIAATGASHDG